MGNNMSLSQVLRSESLNKHKVPYDTTNSANIKYLYIEMIWYQTNKPRYKFNYIDCNGNTKKIFKM